MTTTLAKVLGAAGRIPLSDVMREGARQTSREDYLQEEAGEFACEEVRDHLLPAWLGDPELVLPLGPLRELGLELRMRPANTS